MKHSWLLVLCACGGSATGPVGPGGSTTASREKLLTDVVAALQAGNADALMALGADAATRKAAIDCKDLDEAKHDSQRRVAIDKAIASSRGTKIELVSIVNSDDGGDHRNATFIGQGGSIGSSCTARADLLFLGAEVKLKLTRGNDTQESSARIDLAQFGGRWFLLSLPDELGSEMEVAVATMDKFSKQMCECRDKACADKINEDLTKWGTEMAKKSRLKDEKPDPALAKKAADIMTRYTECMTKMMMLGAGGQDDPPPPEEP